MTDKPRPIVSGEGRNTVYWWQLPALSDLKLADDFRELDRRRRERRRRRKRGVNAEGAEQ